MDYIGENGAGHSELIEKTKKSNSGLMPWPWYYAYCGDIDLIGNKKPQSYYRDVVWGFSPISMFVHSFIPEGYSEVVNGHGWPDVERSWTWPGNEGKTLKVYVYSRCQSVKLELNGKIISEQKMPENSITAIFDVPYEPGILIAKGYIDEKKIASTILKTTGTPSTIRLTADRRKVQADRNDLSYVSVEVTDDKGQVVPNAEVNIQFALSGAGELAAVGNGNPIDLASFQLPERKTWKGKCLAIVRPTTKAGKIMLKATANGLKSAQVEISTHR